MVWLSQKTFDSLKSAVLGEVISPEDSGYDAARRVYNAMIDRRPAVIVRCRTLADVQSAVNWAREFSLPLAVRGGGHSGAGLGTCDDGLVLDLSPMRAVQVDPQPRTVRVEGGCTLADIDRATHPFGLALPTGINATTGIGGLALGGGIGHLTRRYGLTIDSLLGVEMVLADGSAAVADADRNPDLFWAVRGGGGNFGVVTAFHFRLHPVDTVIAGPTVWPVNMTAEALRFYQDFVRQAPETLNGIFGIYTVPPGPPFPASLHLKQVCGITWCFTGSQEEAERLLEPVRRFGPPLFDAVKPVPFPVLQSALDALYPPGLQWYWRSDMIRELTGEATDLHAAFGARLPTPHSRTLFFPVDGAVRRVAADATAFSHRDASFAHVIVGVDPDPHQAGRIQDWVVDYWEALHPHSAGGTYVNFLMHENESRIRLSYGENHTRLSAIKRSYDPGNLFRLNQNIRPAPDM